MSDLPSLNVKGFVLVYVSAGRLRLAVGGHDPKRSYAFSNRRVVALRRAGALVMDDTHGIAKKFYGADGCPLLSKGKVRH